MHNAARGSATPDRPAVTVDTIILTVADGDLKVLLVRRRNEPFAGRWAIPGGFVEPDEPLEVAARRELAEETGLADLAYLEQLYTFGDPGRDPRGRVITVAYYALVPPRAVGRLRAGDDADDARWFSFYRLPPLAFDHDRILAYALERLRAKLQYSTIGFDLLEEEFTLSQAQSLYEIILGRPLDKRNFRRRLLALGLLQPTGRSHMNGAHRPARLYRFVGERQNLLTPMKDGDGGQAPSAAPRRGAR